MDLAVAASLAVLRRRARQTILEYSRRELPGFLLELQALGEVGIFGGLLRDSALAYPSAFESDVDIVVNTEDEAEFDKFFRSRQGIVNRFGGYRLNLSRGVVDVWPLRRTWAFRVGLRKGSSLRDLLGTTYFSWDSIVYSWTGQRLYCKDDYLEGIHRRVVELELAENPHPLGALVRTMRLVEFGRARVGYRLASHTTWLTRQFEDKEIIDADRRRLRAPYLNAASVRRLRIQLEQFVETAANNESFGAPMHRQLTLPFMRNTGSG